MLQESVQKRLSLYGRIKVLYQLHLLVMIKGKKGEIKKRMLTQMPSLLCISLISFCLKLINKNKT